MPTPALSPEAQALVGGGQVKRMRRHLIDRLLPVPRDEAIHPRFSHGTPSALSRPHGVSPTGLGVGRPVPGGCLDPCSSFPVRRLAPAAARDVPCLPHSFCPFPSDGGSAPRCAPPTGVDITEAMSRGF